MTVLEATRKWLRDSCPLVGKGNRFNISHLGCEATEYTLSASGESHRPDVCGCDIATHNLVFAARLPFGVALQANIGAAELFAGLGDWLRQQERLHHYPVGIDGYEVTRVTMANAGMITQADANTARYQIQIQLTLEEV